MAKRVNPKPPELATESAEADWWAGSEGREFLKQQTVAAKTERALHS